LRSYSAADIDWFAPHQANKRMIDASAVKLGIARDAAALVSGTRALNGSRRCPAKNKYNRSAMKNAAALHMQGLAKATEKATDARTMRAMKEADAGTTQAIGNAMGMR
jgi:3-oxoacyl-[acyl-carrier-protein (ACP)] synthase III-like protein